LKNKSDFQRIELLPEMVGLRLDKALSLIPEISSRSRAEALITAENVLVNSKVAKSSLPIKSNDVIEIYFPKAVASDITPMDLKLDILFEDSDVIVVNKPPGLVVHPAAGHQHDTLVNALVAHTDDLAMKFGEDRPGIVHRLDRETSGILVVAKNDFAQENLAQQFKAREVHRHYHAICFGIPAKPEGTIQSYIARHPSNRKKFASVLGDDQRIIRSQDFESSIGKWAITHYKVLKAHPAGLSYLQLKLETGRTHQIRVHLSELGHQIIADPIYGTDRRVKSVSGNQNQDVIRDSPRCALHAIELGFQHPKTDEKLFFKVPWPDFHEIRKHFFAGLGS
jgi:23S rRNA pseudouridine1911/1915/1917 synthase